MTPRESQNHSHSMAPRQCRLWFLWDPNRCTKFPQVKANFVRVCISRCSAMEQKIAQSHCAASFRVRSTSLSVPVAFVWGQSCVQYLADHSQERERSRDRFRKRRTSWTELSKRLPHNDNFNQFASVISRSWPSQTKQKPIWHSWLASMRARLADGLLKTPSRPRKRWASSSAKSCVDITSATKARRRPF